MKATKTLLVISAACLLNTVSVLGQGRIAFANNSTTRIYIVGSGPGNYAVLGTGSTATFGIGPASVQIRLLAGTSSTSLSPVLVGTAANQFFVLNTVSQIPAAQGTFDGGSPLPLPGTDGVTPIFLRMTITETTFGVVSQSPIIQVIPSLSPAAQTPVFGAPGTPNVWTTADDWDYGGFGFGFRIGPPPIPEPSALAFTGLSFAVMFLRRRQG